MITLIHITEKQTGKILDYIPLGYFWDDNHHKSIKDTLEYFEFRTFGDKRYSQYLEKMNRIIIPDEDGTYIEFVIFHAIKYRLQNTVVVDVYAPASYLLLKKAKVIKPQRVSGYTASQHLGFALNATEWRPGIVESDKYRTLDIENHTNPYAYIRRIANEFELEPRFRVETDGNKVIGRYVDLLERVGEWQGREVEFGRDLLGIERKVDDSNVVTALIGLGPEREDGTRLEVMVEDEEALQRWGIPNPQTGELMHLIETYEPESTDQEMTIERLTELTRNELEKRISSVVEYTADVADLEKVPGMENKVIRFGDTIKIKDAGFNPPLYLEARVHTQDRSLSQPEKKKVTLGDFIEYTEEEVHAIWKSLKAEIAKKVSMSDVTEVTYTKTEIDEKDAGVYQDSTYYADNVSETKKQEAIQVAATDATNKANQAETNAKSHADTVAEQKKQEAINAAIADAETKITTAKTELEADIALKADAEWVNGQLQLKENAIHRGATAPTDTTKLWLDTSVVPNVLKRYDSATSSWVKATPTTAGEVNAYTKTEVDNALNSKVSVTQYTTDMNGVITRLDSAESRITQTENEIATKVSNTTYQQDKAAIESDISALETRVTNAETNITQNANQIELKANKTEVYTKTEIDSQFSTVNQQISQLDAELSIQADQIATKVSRTEFESFNDIKNLTKLNGIELVDQSFKSGIWGDLSDRRNKSSITNEVVKAGYSYSIKTVGYAWITTGFIPINPELPTYISFDIYYKDNTNSVLYAGLEHYDKDKVPTEENGGCAVYHISNKSVTNANTWQTFEGWRETMPKNTKFVRLRLLVRYNNSTNDISYIQNISVKQLGTNIVGEYNSRLSTAETSITQLSNQIELKAEQTTVDTLENRISSAESSITLLSDEIDLKVNKDGVISAINLSPETAKLQASKIELDGYVEAKHIKSLNGLNINDQFIVDSNGNVKFAGHLEGATGTFRGSIDTPMLTVGAEDIRGYNEFGLRLQTAQWQPDLNEPFRKTGYIVFNTLNDALELYKVDLNGREVDLAGLLINAKIMEFLGDIRAYGFLYSNAIDHFGGGIHLYVRPKSGGEVRATATGTTSRWVDIRGRFIYADSVDINTGTHVYIRPSSGGEVRATVTGTTNSYAPIRAKEYNPPNSLRKMKKNIEEFTDDVLGTFRNIKTYTFNYKFENDGAKKTLGLMLDEAPEVIWNASGDSIDMYSSIGYLFTGLKQTVAELDVYKAIVKNLEKRVAIIENKK